MATKRSRSKKTQQSSLFSRLVGLVWILVVGGGIAGWAAPELPVVGPLVDRFVRGASQAETADTAARSESDGQSAQQPDRDWESVGTKPAAAPTTGHVEPRGGPRSAARTPAGTIRVASFNIQVFGKSKSSKSWVMEILAQIVRQFDIVAIQEIRCKETHLIPNFAELVNAEGSRYNYVVGPRLGRTISKEQYAFLYDTERIEIDASSPGTIQDPQDELHREPLVARFRARTPQPSNSFTFWLVNAHTDPDEVEQEVDVLADVFLVMQQANPQEDDVILLGDLNANVSELGQLAAIPGITWVVENTTTNTRRSKLYDNLLFHRRRTAEYTGRWGVYDFESVFRLTREQALDVSDHLPVWAEFRVYEAPAGNSARLPSTATVR